MRVIIQREGARNEKCQKLDEERSTKMEAGTERFRSWWVDAIGGREDVHLIDDKH